MSLHHGDLHIGICCILCLQWHQEGSDELSHHPGHGLGNIRCSQRLSHLLLHLHTIVMEQCDSENLMCHLLGKA